MKNLLLFGLQLAVVAANSSNNGEWCNADNCLRGLEGHKGGDKAHAFCQTFTTATVTATTNLPDFVSIFCTGSTVARASSACSCFMKTYTPTATPTITSTSSSSSSISSTPSATPTCAPLFTLNGASETGFNAANTPFSLDLTCSSALNTSSIAIFTSAETSTDVFGTLVADTTVTDTSVTLPGFGTGKRSITVAAFDTVGNPIVQTFSLLFGTITMPVLVLDAAGAPVVGLQVTAGATVYPGIEQNQTTDANGVARFVGLASTTIGLFTQTVDNSIGFGGFAATSAQVTIRLIPFLPASDVTDFNVSKGLTGWTGGSVTDLQLKKRELAKRELALVVDTAGSSALQQAHAEPKVYPFTRQVYIRYKFVTSEVPGGWFGSQFNDYFIVSIRANTGGTTTVSRSMNELGLGAFDGAGATDWYTLTLDLPVAPAPATEWVEFNVGVANVADSQFQSQVIVDRLGDLKCEQCGSCETCPGNPMCQPACMEPPERSCAFYADCAEATVRCGAGGYPLAKGRKNCLAFQSDLAKYTAQGQTFIWATMSCLQRALRDALTCDATCATVYDDAFDSHPACYVNSGYCDLPVSDWWQLIKTVNTDLVGIKSFQQVVQTGAACGGQMIDKIDAEIDAWLERAATDLVNAAVHLAKVVALRAFKKLIQDLVGGLYPIPQL